MHSPPTNPSTPIYLTLLRNALRDVIAPAVDASPRGAMAQQSAQLALGLLTRMIVAARHELQTKSGAAEPSPRERAPQVMEDPAALARLLSADIERRREIERAVIAELGSATAVAAKPAAAALDADGIARLTKFLRALDSNGALEVEAVRAVAGGFSKQTLVVTLRGAASLPGTIVVRRDGEFLASGNSVSFDYPILQHMFAAGVRVPQPLALEGTGSVLGRPFIVVAHVAGATFGDTLDVRLRSPELGRELAQQLARIHQAPVRGLGHVPGFAQAPADRVRAEIESDHAIWRSLAMPAIAVDAAFIWLLAHLDAADGRPCLVHRDIGAHNLLAESNRLTAILDWEIAVIGSAAEDLGYSRYSIGQLMDWDEFVAAYVEAGGERPSLASLDFYTLWGAVRLTVLIAKFRAGLIAGAPELQNLGLAYVGETYLPRVIGRVAEKMESLLARA